MFAKKHFGLEAGDIVDYYIGKVNDDDLRTKNKSVKNVYDLYWFAGFWYVTEIEAVAEALVAHEILGVVCRNDDPGCTYNSSPETTIGIGRKMDSPADYRGVEAESQQPMWNETLTIAEFFSASYCVECTDEEREQWVE